MQPAEPVGDRAGEGEAGGVEGGEGGEVLDPLDGELGVEAAEPGPPQAGQVQGDDPAGPAGDAGPDGARVRFAGPVAGAEAEGGAEAVEGEQIRSGGEGLGECGPIR